MQCGRCWRGADLCPLPAASPVVVSPRPALKDAGSQPQLDKPQECGRRDRIAISGSRDSMESTVNAALFTYEASRRPEAAGGALAVLSGWLIDYAMNEHADLGRSGSVCPFVKQSARLETLRLGISLAGPRDEASVFAHIRSSFAVLRQIPAPRGKERLRTIAIGFPDCASDEGIAMLERVYARDKY